MTEFIRSYRPAMRSNIDLTCASATRGLSVWVVKRPTGAVAPRQALPETGEIVDQRFELVRRKISVGRHRCGRGAERPRDRVSRQSSADLAELGSRSGVPCLAEAMARTTAGLVRHHLSLLKRWPHRQ